MVMGLDRSASPAALLTAAESGDAAAIARLLCHGVSPSTTNHKQQTALHIAALHGHDPIIVELLAAKADNRKTPLYEAAKAGKLSAVTLLLSAKARTSLADVYGRTPRAIALEMGHTSVAELFVDPNAKRLFKAVVANDHDLVTQLLASGASPSSTNERGETPLHLAAAKNLEAVAVALLSAGARAEAASQDGSTPLHDAAYCGATATACALVRAGAPVNAIDATHRTPLYWAVGKRHVDVVHVLLAASADVTLATETGDTPLHGAARNDDPDTVTALLRANASVVCTTKAGKTPRDVAVGRGHDNIVQLLDQHVAKALRSAIETNESVSLQQLLDYGADVNTRDALGRSPLHVAILLHRTAMAVRLVASTANVDAADTSGATPLHAAVATMQLSVVDHLLRADASPNMEDKAGVSALRLAVEQQHIPALTLLLGCRTTQLDAFGQLPTSVLHAAASAGFLGGVDALLTAGATVDLRSKSTTGETALHLAVANGHVDVVERLVAAGANVDAVTTKTCDTPLHVAARRGLGAIVSVLLAAGASVEATNATQHTPVACATPYPDVIAIFGTDTRRRTHMVAALLAAVCDGATDVVRSLVADGLDPNTTNEAGESLLHLAVRQNHRGLLEALLQAPGIRFDQRNADGRTPMILAIQAGHRRLANILHAAAHALTPEISSEAFTMDVDAPLGVGGYGAVYKGTYNGRPVAVKTALGASGVAALIEEMETMQLCHSPYVLELLAVTKMPSPKLILEYMDGGDLRSFLDAKRLNQSTKVDVSSLEVAWVVANALADMHHNGLLHRDIKSPNVLLCTHNYIKLADLGIAREYESNMTMGIGTLRWMAPELLDPKRSYNAAADMYAFGALLTELDTRLVPFAAETSIPEIMRKLGDGALKPTFTSTCPAWLQDLATACLAFDPKGRPTAQDVVNRLKQHLARQVDRANTADDENAAPSSSAERAPILQAARAPPTSIRRVEIEAEDMASGLVAQLSMSPRRPSTHPASEPTPADPSTTEPLAFGNTKTYSGWTTEKLVATDLVCQLCNTTNSLLDDACGTCTEPLPPPSLKLKVLLRRLDAAAQRGLRVDGSVTCFTCSDAYPMTRAACDCGEEFPADVSKIRMLLKRIELASKSKSTP
ncbi:TKL protein kinase [Saprolegnia diclina VS20]|uniref:TKL protein kinase n=1 Tax=Saprolegnia diclina (strain VS20) TaxID=1156394 RepID=T0RDW5_SAPDV|nr:TKL protein kinase [Saprolegnia diclina VS20]EQC30448.1 TKL protein kinase [Saprolegnia diclina VS20]|eukprot:XP_008616041.1 TKL protein kinase [Saprolegnia diclina VS20]